MGSQEAKWRSAALLLGVLLVASLAWGYSRLPGGYVAVPQEEYQELKSSVASLEQENLRLREEVRQIRAEVEKLRGKTVGDFIFTGEEVCASDGRPVVYFFGTSWCPHCRWEKPIIKKVAGEFADSIDFRFYELDLKLAPEEDMKVFRKFSPDGAVPTIVFGCRYYRVGSGERFGEEGEEEVLRTLMCRLVPESEQCARYSGIVAAIP
ncbi:MAG: hypothetical protein GXO66_05300 [Euryarchaeota archaeon]|nr:hypothetical protein [Euryarchaeota archaeon]